MPYKDSTKQLRYQRTWIQGRRKAVISLLGDECQQCGSTQRLEVHHRVPDHKITHRFYSRSWPRIEAEIVKCDLLCVDCHAIPTKEFLRRKALAQPRDAHGFVRVDPATASVPRMGPGVAESNRREEVARVAVT